MTALERFGRRVRALNVYTQDTEIDGRPAFFIHQGDASRAQAKRITRIAAELGIKIDIADKGGIFSEESP